MQHVDANHGPDTSGSQFCIFLRDVPSLDGDYMVFARVVGRDSQDTVDYIASRTVVNDGEEPREELTIKDGGIVYKSEFLEKLYADYPDI